MGNSRKPLTPEQRIAIANLLYDVFLRLRAPGYKYYWDNEADYKDCEKIRAALDRSIAFGEAFHNLPKHMLTDDFDFDYQILSLECYVDRVPDLQEFVERLREIKNM